jgi:lipopolysaccharide biosynthesis glycosyltransferase
METALNTAEPSPVRAAGQWPYQIAIVVAADRAYEWPSLLALLSAGLHSSPETICVLIGDSLDEAFVACATSLFTRFHIRFEHVAADLGRYTSLPLGFHFSRAAYGRLLAVSATAGYAPRTLYLDADTLVIADISPLATFEIGESHVVAAVRAFDIPTCGSPGGVANWEQRGVAPTAPFFNSGVLLIENDAWVRNHLSRRVLAELEREPQVATFADQGALNALLVDRWTELTSIWNYQLIRTPAVRIGPFAISRHYRFALRETRILHFFQSVKPWDRRYPPGALANLYRDAWTELLPVPAPSTQTFREWICKRH